MSSMRWPVRDNQRAIFMRTSWIKSALVKWGLAGCLAVVATGTTFGQTRTNIIEGEIAYPGERDVFTLSLDSTKRFYFDALTNASSLRWHLGGPSGVVVTNRSFVSSDGNNGNPLLVLPEGDYVMSIDAASGDTPGYAFRLVDLTEATLIAPGTVVTNGQLLPRRSEFYQFTAAAGDQFTFTRNTAVGSTYWRLLGPYGNYLFQAGFNNVGTNTVPDAGTYVLFLESDIQTATTNSYSFTVNHVGNQPRNFTGTPLSFGTAYTGPLLPVGTTNAFTFTVDQPKWLVLDVLTNRSGPYRQILGPGGTVVSYGSYFDNGSMGENVLKAPAGDYQLLVNGHNNHTNAYLFRIVDASQGALVPLDTVVTGTNSPASGVVAYRVQLTAGQSIYFDSLAYSGFTYQGHPFVKLIDPHDRVLIDGGLFDTGPIPITLGGTYTLLVAGRDLETSAQGTYSFRIVTADSPGAALPLNSIVGGAIEKPGQTRTYTFSLAEPRTVTVDIISNALSTAYWTLRGPQGTLENFRNFGSGGWFVHRLPAGDYTMTVAANGDDTNTFAFRMLDLATATDIAPGATVNGSLNPATSTTAYRFVAGAGQRFFFDVLSYSGFTYAGAPYWLLIDPFGNTLFDQSFYDVGAMTLPADGEYTLLVGGHHLEQPHGVGNFSFVVSPIAPGTQPLVLGAATGGAIVHPGQTQTYTFTLADRALVSVDLLSNSVNQISWTLRGPHAATVASASFTSSGWFVHELLAGEYTFTVSANGDATGSYGFRILNLSAATPIALGSPVNDALVPTSGTTAFRFEGTAGQTIYFDSAPVSGFTYAGAPYWLLLDAYGTVLMDRFFGDFGPLTLPANGRYTLLVGGNFYESTPSGTFGFTVNPVTNSTQAIAVGATVAGTIAHPGQARRYTFTIPSATQVLFDTLTNNPSLRWVLTGPTGTLNNNQTFGSDGLFIYDAAPGAYTVTVDAAGSEAVGEFFFRVLDLAAARTISPLATVEGTNSPAAGANIYRFQASAGDRLFIDALSASGYLHAWSGGSPSQWRLVSPYGDDLFNAGFSDRGPFTLSETGTYMLFVGGSQYDPPVEGVHSFRVVIDPATPQPMTLDSLVTGTIGLPGQQQRYTFTLAQPAKLIFDSWTNSTFRWRLDGPNGTVVDNRGFNGSDSYHYGSNPVLSLSAGAYQITVTAPGDAVGGFAFQMLNLASAPALALNTTVNSGLSPGWSSRAYRIDAQAGDRLRVTGQTLGGNAWSVWRLIDPLGQMVWSDWFAQSVRSNLFVVGGAYTLLVEGAVEASTNAAFTLSVETFPNIPPPPLGGQPLVLGQTYTNSLEAGPGTNSHRLTLAAPAVLYFNFQGYPENLSLRVLGSTGLVQPPVNLWTSEFMQKPWVDLPAGDYEFQIVQGSGQARSYRFRVMDLLTAPLLPLNTAVTNVLVPSSASVVYRLEAPPGAVLFHDGLVNSGHNYANQTRVFTREQGQVLVHGSPGSDDAPFSLQPGRTHFFAVEGSWFNTTPQSTVAFVLQSVQPATNALVLGAPVQGNLEGGGDTAAFTFSLPDARAVFFDALTNTYWNWSINGPGGVHVATRDSRFSDGADWENRVWLPAGDYTLLVASTGPAPTPFAFRLIDAQTATPTALGAVNSTNLHGGIGLALYRFNAAPNQRVHLRSYGTAGFNSPPSGRLYDANGRLVQYTGNMGNDDNSVLLELGGEYLFQVDGRTYYNSTGTGHVSFAHQPITYSTNAIALEQVVEGVLSGAQDVDHFTFTLAATNVVFFDALTNSYWTLNLVGPEGSYMNNRDPRFSGASDLDHRMELVPGDYRLSVASQSTAPTYYRFVLRNAALAQITALGTTNQTVLGGDTGLALYRFPATAGQRVYFQSLAVSGFGSTPRGRLYQPNGRAVDDFSVGSDRPGLLLPETGDYLFVIDSHIYYHGTGTGTVSSVFVPVNHQTNALALNVAVTNAIASAGTTNYHTFSLGAETRVFFDALTNGAARWNLIRSGSVLVSQRPFDDSDGTTGNDSSLLLPAGDYVLSVSFPADGFGTYGFRLLTPAVAMPLALDTVVTNESSPSSITRLYQFNGSRGARLYFDGMGIVSGGGSAPALHLYTPVNTRAMSLTVSSDRDGVVLPADGSYLLTLEGRFSPLVATQTTAFAFWTNPEKPSEPLFQTNSSPDLIVTGVGVVPPSGVQSGQGITVGWTVRNTGGAATASSFTDRVVVRNTGTGQILVNSTLLYDSAAGGNGPIAPSTQRARQLAVQLPDGPAAAGTLEVTVTTDSANNVLEQNSGGTGEANNSATASFSSALAPYPDLRVASVSVQPTNGWRPAQAITVSWVVTNSGPRATSNSWSDRVILRNLTTAQTLVTTNVLYDAALPENGSLLPAGFRARQVALTLPNSGQVYGRFEISVEADGLGGVFEHFVGIGAETNNLTSIETLSAPDLRITGLAVNPVPGPFSGARLDLSWQLANDGTAIADDGFYERIRVVHTGTLQELVNTTPYYGSGPITNGTSRNRTLSVNLPDGPQSVGALEITVTADTFNNRAEANAAGTAESNNSQSIPLNTTLDTYPDLLVSAVTVEPMTLVSGTNLTIRWTLTNSGTGPVLNNFYDRVLVVNTNQGVTLLNTSVYYATNTSGPITNGTTRERSYAFTLPNNTTGAGGLLVTVVADINNNVFEYNLGGTGEANNTNRLGVSSSLTPLPDLAVVSIQTPATAYPGVPFEITYGVTNRGTVPAVGPWNDTLYLSADDQIGFDQALGTHQVTNTIPANGFLSITRTLSIPPASEAGPLYLVVTTDSGGGRSETDESNNSLIATNPIVVPGALTLTLNAFQIAENAVNPNVSATVTRNGSRASALVVNLSSTDPSEATVPATVTIPAGQASAGFFVTAQPDAEFDGAQVAFVVASASGYDPATNSLTVLDSNQRRVTIAIAPTNVVEGTAAVATITRDPATATNLVVQLAASDANQVSVPATVVLSAGMASTNIAVTAIDDSLIERTNAYIVTVTAQGHLPSSASLAVVDNDIPDVVLSLASRNVSEGAGPNATDGTVTLPSPRPRNIVVLLSSSNTNAARVPASVTIPSGSISASFPVSAVNNTLVDGPKTTSIIGYVADSVFGQPLRPTTPDILTVTDDDGATLRIFIADDLVPEGRNPATTAVVTRNTDTAAPLVVSLASDLPTEATVPATVTIPAGTNSAVFNIASLTDAVTDGNRTVTITATATGFTAGSDTVVVSDADLPDIIVTEIAAATNALTGQNLTVTFTLGNNGLRGANTNIVQRVLISTDPLLGADSIGAQPAYNGPLGIGDSIQQQATVRMPDAPGSYWIIVQADVFNAVPEVLENNNARVAAVPVVIGAAHTATVSTAVTVSQKGEPVPLTGSATSLATGQPAALAPVTVHVEVRGTRRTIQAITDLSGNFAVDFVPLPTEAGLYRIAATHPSTVNPPAWQDQFSILGFNIESPGTIVVVEGGTNSGSSALVNLSDQPLTGLVAEVYTNHPSIQVSAVLTNNLLPGDSRVYLRFDVRAIDTSAVNSTVGVRVTTAEGLTNYLVFSVRQSLFTPALAALPSFLQSTMLLGHQTPVSFILTNAGSRATGPLEILIPSLPWLALSSPQQLPPLEPGTNTVITLLLTPPPDLAFGDYTGSIAINSSNAALSVQYRFRTVSDGIGSLKVVAEDEYTYFTPGSPRVTNAWVRVTDGLSGALVATNVTGADGSVLFTNLAEAYYIVDVGATAHSSYRQSAFVRSGDTTNVVAFLQRQTVSYTFTVVPTTVQDRYRFEVESTFETQVPVPVVTISPASVDLSQYAGEDFQIQFTIENHGLIEARDVRLNIPHIEAFQITPLITNIGTLGARQSITIPATVHRGPPPEQSGLRQQTDYLTGQCSVTAEMLWNYLCGPNVVDKENAVYVFDSTGCDLPALYNAVYELVPIAGGGGGGGGGAAPTIPANAGSNFSPPPGFKGVCRPAPLNIVVPAGRPGAAQASLDKVMQMAAEVCARVKLKLSQQAVLTRDAFNATLEIDNETASPLSELLVTLSIQSGDSTNATDLFDVRAPQLVGMTGVDGTGALPAFTAGNASWILVPTLDAAPTNGARVFMVGGTMSYVQDGIRVTLPLAAAPIQVHPQPELLVRYFHERDVFADDPFTQEIEPSLPYALAVRVDNVGYGEARNMKITSAKPEIVENEKGLLIDFKIIGAQLENQAVTPSLEVDLGPIGVGSSKIARWLFTSTLQGSFTNYSASFEHLDAVAGKRLSLVRATEIHELNRIVNVDGAAGDGRPDMLVNDLADPQFLPDTLYLSQGPIVPVTAVTNAGLSNPISVGALQTTLTAPATPGWSYFRIGNPGGTNFVLRRIVRSNGTEIGLNTNAWTTDRFFFGGEIRPTRTNLLHFVDFDSTGSYTLVYESLVPVPDTTPPSTQLAPLPAISSADFNLGWTGTDDISGVAFYDVYVSTNGGPFGRWASRLTSSGTVFRGTAGTAYGFYVLATDAAGNAESAPPAAQAATTVTTAVNQAPVLAAIPDQSVVEGRLFSLQPVASDPDGAAQTLAFRLLPGTGSGALIDPATGAISWQTTGAHGGTTNLFSLVVADNGTPSLSATQTFRVRVFEENTAPVVQPSVLLVADEGSLFNPVLTAQDSDVPAQSLTWQMLQGAPAGLLLNPSGQILWTPGESAGPGTNFFSVRVTDSGFPALSATQAVTLVVQEVNLPPVLAPVSPKAAFVGVQLTVTNTATDPDQPANQLTFSLGAGAPRGARINPTNGVFTWTPTPEYASTTVPITIRVTDDGLPALVASTVFEVLLGDFMGIEIGSAVVLTNEAAALPIRLTGTANITNATAVITVGGPVLASATVATVPAHLQGATLTPLGNNRYALRLVSSGGLVGSTNAVAMFQFTATNAGPSAFVPVTVSEVTGTRATGSAVDSVGSADGRIVFINREPLMELARQPLDSLTLFGRPGTGYELQFGTNLLAGGWRGLDRIPLTNRVLSLPAVVTNGLGFFRTMELGQPRPLLDLLGYGSGTMEFMLYGEAGASYDIQTSPQIVGGTWTTRQTVALAVGYRAVTLAPPGDGVFFVRAVKR